MNQNFKKAKAIEENNKKRFLALNPKLDEGSGIYILLRSDENQIKYAFIGQAKHILTRLAQHMVGYQHIDLSLKKYGLYSESNIHGWRVGFVRCKEEELDEMEKELIRSYAAAGYQLRNKTAGSQGVGKVQIDEYRPSKGYRDGLEQGRKALAKELKHIIDKHLTIELKAEKKANKTSQKALEKFMGLLEVAE